MVQPLIVEKDKNRVVLCPAAAGIPGLMLTGRAKFVHSARDGMLPHHHQSSMEILYLDRGEQVYSAQGKLYSLTGGDVYIAFPHEMHGTGGHPEEMSTLFWIQVDLDCEDGFLNLSNEFGKQLKQALLHINKRHFKGDARLKQSCNSIINHLLGDDPLGCLKAQQAAVQFLLLVLEMEMKPVAPGASKELAPAMRFIHDNVDAPIDVAALAKMCFMSESHFRNLFREQLGSPPQEYIMRLKIKEAKKLIQQGCSVTSTAQRTGFGSASYFSTQFKKYTSYSPQEYKKRCSQDMQGV